MKNKIEKKLEGMGYTIVDRTLTKHWLVCNAEKTSENGFIEKFFIMKHGNKYSIMHSRRHDYSSKTMNGVNNIIDAVHYD